MSDATNDTTRTKFDTWLAECLAWYGDPGANIEFVPRPFLRLGMSLARSERDAALADLLRLVGPPCDYPPCEGKRAIEHGKGTKWGCFTEHHSFVGKDGEQCAFMLSIGTRCQRKSRSDYPHQPCLAHPPSPAIEQFLRERRS